MDLSMMSLTNGGQMLQGHETSLRYSGLK